MIRAGAEKVADRVLTVLAVVGVLCVVMTLMAAVFDLRVLVFKSGSMSPTIQTGAVALTRQVEAHDLEVGDIVSVPVDDTRVTHRIQSITRDGNEADLVLKGDANQTVDQEPYTVTSADRVLFDVPLLGYVVDAFSGPLGVFVGGMLAAVLLFLVLRPRPGRRRRRRGVQLVAAVVTVFLLVPGLLLSGRVTPTQAFWQDSGTVTSGNFAAHTVISQTMPTCTNEGGILGILGYARLHWNSVDPRYEYAWTATRVSNGAVLASGTVAPAATGAERTLDIRSSLLSLTIGSVFVDVTVRARLSASPTWQAGTTTTVRVQSSSVLLGISIRCA